MNGLVADQRVLRGAAATLKVTLLDADGTAVDASGALTVGVKRADSTVLIAAGTATTHGSTGEYSVAVTPAMTASLDLLTATWTDAGDGSVATSTHEIVGGYLFSVAAARASDASLADATKYPDAEILAKRREVEEEAEAICGLAFVPRFRRAVLDGSGEDQLQLGDPLVRVVRSVRVFSTPTTYVDLTSDQLTWLATGPDSILRRMDRRTFLEGRQNVIVVYEYGCDRPPADVVTAALLRLRYKLTRPKSGIPDRATSFVSADGGTFRLDMPSTYKTGIPDVDAVYSRYSELFRGDADRPASGRFDLDPQWGSIFHAGRR